MPSKTKEKNAAIAARTAALPKIPKEVRPFLFQAARWPQLCSAARESERGHWTSVLAPPVQARQRWLNQCGVQRSDSVPAFDRPRPLVDWPVRARTVNSTFAREGQLPLPMRKFTGPTQRAGLGRDSALA
jgi:hypothetical protein